MPKKDKIRVCQRAYWGKNLTFPNTTLRIPMVAQPLTNERNHIYFHNGCPACHSQLKRVDYCPVCSTELKANVEKEFGVEKLNQLIADGLLAKVVSSSDTIKIHTIGEKEIVFTKQELESIKTAVSDMVAIGYGKIEQINPQHIDNSYALLPDLNVFADDGDYRRLLYALKMSGYYLIVNYDDRGNTKKGVIIYYNDKITQREFLMLVNTKDAKDLNTAIEYTPNVLEDKSEQMVIQFLQKALPQTDFVDSVENEMEKKKEMLIALKLSGQPIPIEHKEQPKPMINGFATAIQQVEQNNTKQIEAR